MSGRKSSVGNTLELLSEGFVDAKPVRSRPSSSKSKTHGGLELLPAEGRGLGLGEVYQELAEAIRCSSADSSSSSSRNPAKHHVSLATPRILPQLDTTTEISTTGSVSSRKSKTSKGIQSASRSTSAPSANKAPPSIKPAPSLPPRKDSQPKVNAIPASSQPVHEPQLLAITADGSSGADQPATDVHELIASLAQTADVELTDMEMKIREAYVRMRELDRLLSEKIAYEKQVKSQRAIDAKAKDAEDDNFFTTQPKDGEKKLLKDEKKPLDKFAKRLPKDDDEEEHAKLNSEHDFIRRNIELAADGGGIFAMTEDEKWRLHELLRDFDVEGALDNDDDDTIDQKALNRKLKIDPGFALTEDDTEQIQGIDEKLKAFGSVDRLANYPRFTSAALDELEEEESSGIEDLPPVKKAFRDSEAEYKRLALLDKRLGVIQETVPAFLASKTAAKMDREELDQLLALCRIEQGLPPKVAAE